MGATWIDAARANVGRVARLFVAQKAGEIGLQFKCAWCGRIAKEVPARDGNFELNVEQPLLAEAEQEVVAIFSGRNETSTEVPERPDGVEGGLRLLRKAALAFLSSQSASPG